MISEWNDIDYYHWSLQEGLEIIRHLQGLVKDAGYHLALAGGVLNKGESKKDLDIIALELHNLPVNKDKLIEIITSELGEFRDGNEDYDGFEARNDNLLIFENKQLNGKWKRIDIFIYGDK